MKRLLEAVATLGPVGYAPRAPATVASALTALAGWFLPPPPFPLAILLLLIGFGLACWICELAEQRLGHDAHPIVLDEVIGQSIALLGAPHAWPAYLTAFVLFRILDIWKPLGAREAQSLPGGIGVVSDDVIAGLASCVALHALLWAARVSGLGIG